MTNDDEQAQAARNRALYAIRRPLDFTPWEDQALDGWRLDNAVYALTLPEWRDKVRNLLADMDVGLTPERWAASRHGLWQHIHWRLQQGQLVARGRVDATDVATPEVIDRDVLDNAVPDFSANTLTCGLTVFRSIRVFPSEDLLKEGSGAVTATASSKSSVAPEPRHGDEFVQECCVSL